MDEYDLFLLDMWGVMHNGSRPYDGVLECIKELKKNGKEMVILSNSSKRTDSSIKNLKKLGFDPSDFSQIITSGEVSHAVKVFHVFLYLSPPTYFFALLSLDTDFLSHAFR